MSSTVIIKINKATIENGNAETLLNEVREYLSNQPNKEYLKLKERFALFLIKKGLNQTQERIKVLEKICIKNLPFTMNTIHSRVIKDLYVNIRTVNRTFKLLIDANIIKRVDENENNELFKTTYFELCH